MKIRETLTITCDTHANPAPTTYSWYGYNRDNPADSSAWTMAEKDLHLGRVQTRDEVCYKCNATNIIGTGRNSDERCIQVLCKLLGCFGFFFLNGEDGIKHVRLSSLVLRLNYIRCACVPVSSPGPVPDCLKTSKGRHCSPPEE